MRIARGFILSPLLMLVSLSVFSAPDPKEMRTFQQGKSPIMSVRFTPDNTRLVSAGADGTIVMRDVKTGRYIWQRSLDDPSAGMKRSPIAHLMDMELSPDGKTIAISYWRDRLGDNAVGQKSDERLVLLDAENGREVKTLVADDGMPRGVAFSPDGRSLVAVGAHRTVRLWGLPEGKEQWTIKLKTRGISAEFSADGKLLAIATEAASDPEPVGLYEAETGRLVRSFPPSRRNVGGITFSPDGRLRASSGALNDHGVVIVSDVATDRKRATYRLPADLSASSFSPDNKTLVVGTEKGQIVLIGV
jgi:WD40 repeat protein